MNIDSDEPDAAQDGAEHLTIVVVTFQSGAVLADCLRSIAAATAGIRAWQLVVVDNASSDGCLTLAAEIAPEALCLSTGRNAGYAAAINYGLKVSDATGDVLVMNPDVRLHPGSLASMTRAMRTSRAGIVAPKLVDERGRLLHSQRRDPSVGRALGEALLGGQRAGRSTLLGEVVTDDVAYERAGWIDWATGAALLVSTACRAAVGQWDESFFLYSEETDYCQRARRAGFGVRFEPSAVATHLGGDLEVSGALRRHLVRNKLNLYRRTHSRSATAIYRATLMLNDTLRALVGSAPHREGVAELLKYNAPANVPSTRARTESTSKRGFVFFSAQDFWYHNRSHSDIQLARNLAQSRTVLFVNSIGMRMPRPGVSTEVTRRIIRKLRSIARAVRRPLSDTPDFYVMTPFLLPFYGNRVLRALNARIVALQVSCVLRCLHITDPDTIVTIPTAADVIRHLQRRSLIVNRSDKYSAYEETDQSSIREMERSLLRDADAAVFVSHLLMEEESKYVGGKTVFLGHGVDFDHFAAANVDRVASRMTRIPRPRIGFFGGLDDYVVDFELLEKLAKQLPHAQLVLIGDATCPMDGLTKYPNVHWLGPCSYESLPTYGVGFDVAIMPWLTNEWIEHCNPIKAKEYLALGLPVVTTRYPEAHWLSDAIEIAADHDEFVSMVTRAIDGDAPSSREERRARVKDDSWAARANVLRDLADQAGH